MGLSRWTSIHDDDKLEASEPFLHDDAERDFGQTSVLTDNASASTE